MAETSGRLLKLLSLLQTPREWPGPELAERLGVTQRTVRNDVDRLRQLGYPVLASRGSVGGYRLSAGAAMPPLLLDDDEAVAIAVALGTASGGAVDGLEETALRALTKLLQVLPKRLGGRVDALQAHTVRVAGRRRGAERRRAGCWPRSPRPPATARSSGSPTPTTPAPPPSAGSSPTGSSTGASAGTSSPSTSSATTGAPSAATG